MLVFDLLKHKWKQNFRARGFYKNVVVNIILGVFGLYFMALFLFFGFFLGELLTTIDLPLNPVEIFHGGMLWLILVVLFFRFFVQQLNTLNLPTYQMLPVKRSALIRFLILKPLASPINYITLLVVIPFAARTIPLYYDGFTAFRFVVHFIFIIWFNSLLAAFLKRKFGTGVWSVVIFLGILVGLGVLEYFRWFSLFGISTVVFGFLTQNMLGSLLLMLFPVGGFLLNNRFFAQNYYPETFNKNVIKESSTSVAKFSFLDRFGVPGELISLELKLLFRHKRTKAMLYMSVFFLFYGLMFYNNSNYPTTLLFFSALFITGFTMLVYGQWVISWDSTHFDALMTKNIPVRSYMEANYYLMIAFNVIGFVLTTPYFFFGEKIIYLHIAAFLFNAGINIPILLYFASYNSKRIELSQGTAFNYQGTTLKNFLAVGLVLMLPVILMLILSLLFTGTAALWAIAALGLLGILCQKPILSLCVKQFNAQKYKLAEGFREKE